MLFSVGKENFWFPIELTTSVCTGHWSETDTDDNVLRRAAFSVRQGQGSESGVAGISESMGGGVDTLFPAVHPGLLSRPLDPAWPHLYPGPPPPPPGRPCNYSNTANHRAELRRQFRDGDTARTRPPCSRDS